MKNIINKIIVIVVLWPVGMFSMASPEGNSNFPDTHIVMHYETTINRPASEVWPHLVNFSSWFTTDFVVKHVSGEKGEEGEIQRLYNAKMPLKGQENQPPFLLKAIGIIPNRLFFGINLTNDGSTPTANNILHLVEFEGRTRVLVTMTKRMQSSNQEDYDKALKYSEFMKKDARDRWENDYFPRLKRLVED